MTVKDLQRILETKDPNQIVSFEYKVGDYLYLIEEITAARTQSDGLILIGKFQE